MTNLDRRFVEFSKSILTFCSDIKYTSVTTPLINQLIRSATSIGANYVEAQSGISRKDFRAKVYISLKEADETKYWLELIASTTNHRDIQKIRQECDEICKILSAITKKLS